jgi:transcriptional regulator with XRE-family HTH domain
VSAPKPHHRIDAHVGGRVRQRRTELGLSQESLGAAMGLSFQQIQKYEKGASRIGAGRLFQVARALDVPPAYFFAGIDGAAPRLAAPPLSGKADDRPRRQVLELVQAFNRIGDAAMRRRLLAMIKALAKAD